MDSPSCLLKFQIGPVKEFISQARSTRDLWSGSYLLSWLTAAGIRALMQYEGASLIFPAVEDQPLLDLHRAKMQEEHTDLLTPNIPNVFVAELRANETKATACARVVEKAIHDEWRKIADACLKSELLPQGAKGRFNEQVKRQLSISWQVTPNVNSYEESYRNNGRILDAVRQTRDFIAWQSGDGSYEKDSLSGREEAIVGGKQWQSMAQEMPYGYLFKHADHLSAVNFIKRIWHLAYLDNQGLKIKNHQIRSIPAIAARDFTDEANDDYNNTDLAKGEKYLAAIAFDGDSIGKWISGELLSPSDRQSLRRHHNDFSKALSNFAKATHRILNDAEGFLIYAGGDDVLALVPAEEALKCAFALRQSFREATSSITGVCPQLKTSVAPDGSAGIAIAHFKAPLQDIIREARHAEQRAKHIGGRSAFSVTLMKRSGEISYWGSRWESGGLALYQEISRLLSNSALSSSFSNRVCQLLEPYLTRRSGLSRQEDALDVNTAKEVILKEFLFSIDRQSLKKHKASNGASLKILLGNYLTVLLDSRVTDEKHSDVQGLFNSIIGLCSTVDFVNRNRLKKTTAQKQALA